MSRDPVAVAFGRVLLTARRERRVSREEVAKAGAFPRTYPSLVERGIRSCFDASITSAVRSPEE